MKNKSRQTFKSKYQKQVDKSHYDLDQYLNQERWITYYHQIRGVKSVAKMLNHETITILEIGVGDKIVSNVLKNMGLRITAMDIDPELKPDYVGALPNITVKQKEKFDCILCCEVLEHVQYKDAEKSLIAMARMSKYCVISVPHKGITLSLTIKPWFFKTRKCFISFKDFKKHKFKGEHYWELDAQGASVEKFKESIEKAGFQLIKDYRIPEFPYTHFFIIKSLIQ